MSLTLAAILVSSQPLAFIDRAALRTLARAEARAPSAGRRPAARLSQLCRAAGVSADATRESLARVNSMAGPEVSILKATCAAHLSATRGRGAKLAAR